MLSNLVMKAYAWAQSKRAATAEESGQTLIEYSLIIGVVVVLLWGLMMITGLADAFGGAIEGLIGVFENPLGTTG